MAVAGVSVGLLGASIGSSTAMARDKNCDDFSSHHQAQKWFKKHGGSRHNNVAGLDADHDGIACEDLP